MEKWRFKNHERRQNKMKKLYISLMAVIGCLMSVPAFAAFTLPTLPTTDLETAGTAVAALIGVAVVIGVVFRLMKKA
jgi:protein-S-isoprenylcysteine O-methyltransferase Ste14